MPGEHSELISMLNELLEKSNNLRAALQKRDIDGIWQASGAQEALLSRFQRLALFRGPTPLTHREKARTPSKDMETVNTLVSRIRTVQRTNKAMSAAFLAIINRTLSSLSTGGSSLTGTYGASGNRDVSISPFLVEQQG